MRNMNKILGKVKRIRIGMRDIRQRKNCSMGCFLRRKNNYNIVVSRKNEGISMCHG